MERSINTTPRSQMRTSVKCSSTGEAHELVQRSSHSKDMRFQSMDFLFTPIENKLQPNNYPPAKKGFSNQGDIYGSAMPGKNTQYASEEEEIYRHVYSSVKENYEIDKARDTLLNIAARDSSKSVKIKLLLSLKENLLQKIAFIKRMKHGEVSKSHLVCKKAHSRHESIITVSTSDEFFSKENQRKIIRLLKSEIEGKIRDLSEIKRVRNIILLEYDDIQSEVEYVKSLLEDRRQSLQAANCKISKAMAILTELSQKGAGSSKIIRKRKPEEALVSQSPREPNSNRLNTSTSNQSMNSSLVEGVHSGFNAILNKIWKVGSVNKVKEDRILERIFTDTDDTKGQNPKEREIFEDLG